MFKKFIITLAILPISLSGAFAQQLSQTIRGSVVDKISNTTLPGANIIILNSDPVLGAATDMDGNFKITKVPVGKHTLKITFLGYKEMTIPNVIVNSGKEVVLSVELEENIILGKEIVITDQQEKYKSINEMSTVSTRTFSVEETQKYAAAVNDPGRMASSFAGVISSDDGNNSISIRGNSPTGLLWRMEGVEIPNPNHFSVPGSSGGGISILSAQVMSNSDFMTGAFAAEYGNALSGVFDIRLRKGNNEKAEYTLQAGFLGLDASVEGPFKKGYNGSYLINYRYSTLSILGKMGVGVGDGATDFQDLSYNIFLPTQKFGNFTLFGFGGLSSQKYDAKPDSSEWEDEYQRYSSEFIANTGAAGITHAVILGKETYLKSAFVASLASQSYVEERLDDEYVAHNRHNEYSDQGKFTLTSTLNHKFNSRLSLRTGIILNNINFDVKQIAYDPDINATKLNLKDDGSTYTMQLYAQSNYHLTEALSVNVGLHYFHLTLNNTYSIEPRASVKYELTKSQSVSLGYGLHSQLQPIGVYFAKDDNNVVTNKNLEMSKSHHFVAAYDRMLTESLRMKMETYYQSLFNIPVRSDELSSFSMVNVSEGYIANPMVNKGTGHNYGLELTLEQFLKKDYYFLLSGSLYEAKYKGSDEVLRDTRYNGNYSLVFTAGKEFESGKKLRNRVFGMNIKTTYRGGFRDTPIDLEASQALPGEGTVYKDDEAYTIKYPAYFRTDIRFSMKKNRPNSTQTLALDIQNVTNRKNVYGSFYNKESNSIKTYYQTSLIPILSYKIEF